MEALSWSIPLFNDEGMCKVCSRSSQIRFVCVWRSYPWQKAAKEINLDLGLLIDQKLFGMFVKQGSAVAISAHCDRAQGLRLIGDLQENGANISLSLIKRTQLTILTTTPWGYKLLSIIIDLCSVIIYCSSCFIHKIIKLVIDVHITYKKETCQN